MCVDTTRQCKDWKIIKKQGMFRITIGILNLGLTQAKKQQQK